MPDRKRTMTFRGVLIFAVILSALTLSYIEKTQGREVSVTTVGLFIILLGSIAGLMAMQHAARCPDCRRQIREVYEDVHPRAAEYHLFFVNIVT